MVNYNAYIQLTPRNILVVVTNEKNKNQVVIVDSFQMDIKDYINENGLIQYPLILAEDIANKINNERYSVKDVILIISPKDSIITMSQENAILNSKELAEFAKTKAENNFKKHPEAYEMGWMHTGDIFDDGAPYSTLLQYCYPLREINKLKKAFLKNKIHITNVLLPEMATAALFSQYFDEFNDPTTLIIESGFVSSPNSATTTYWYKRNILENMGGYKIGFISLIKELGNVYSSLSHHDIATLILTCGIFKEYPTDDASEIFSLNGINQDEWFAVATRAFHSFATTLRSEIQRRTEKPDTIVLTGPIACINGVKEYLYHNYSFVVDVWKNKVDLKIGQTAILYNSSVVQSPMFSTVIGAVYFQHWAKGFKKGTLSKPILEIDINSYKNYILIGFITALLYAGYVCIPGLLEVKALKEEQKQIIADTQTAQSIELNISKFEQNIAAQKQFLEKTQKNSYDIKEFMFDAILLKPERITIISIDTPNYLEKVADTQPYYYIKKAVEDKLKANTEEMSENNSTKYDSLGVSGKDWTFGLDWTGVPMTTAGIEKYLIENNQLNVVPYLITKVVVRGYGPSTDITSFASDLGKIKGVQKVGIISEIRTIPDGGGSSIESNVFEINVWFGGEIDDITDSENSN